MMRTLERAEPFPADQDLGSLHDCGYRNATDRIVILRCCGPQQFYLERVIFPFEVLTFQCPPASKVEVWTHGLGGPELLETLRIEDLILTAEPAGVASGLEGFEENPFRDSPWLQAG